MGSLKVLPAQIANMIAAGEVVQRPASVVKELMENAVDAGASQISVIVADAGRTLIQVIDNGCGMSAADAVLCFERHATSKIASAEDLEDIMTYGFRGEALASIAAVSEVTLRTRKADSETATEVRIGGDGKTRTSSVAAPAGSNFAIRNLFYNTPARRKFLKSDNVELKHIIEEFTRVAVTRPEIGFTLTNGSRDIFVLKKAKSRKFRIQDLLGATIGSELVDISAETSVVRLQGYIGRPESARKTLGNQFMFVNGRYFRSNYLHKAVMKAYEDLIPDGVTPSYFIFLETDPHSIDVNIHPTKTEVKFEDDSVIFQVLYACIKESLGRNSFGASIDFDTSGAVELPQLGKNFEQYAGLTPPQIGTDPNYDPFRSSDPINMPNYDFSQQAGEEQDFGFPSAQEQTEQSSAAWNQAGPEFHGPAAQGAGYSAFVDKRDDYGKLFDDNPAAASRTLIVHGKYILTPVMSGIMVVHVSRARERIFHDRNIKLLRGSSHVTQTSMFPVQVQVGAAQRLLFDEHAGMLGRLGFDITPFGTDTVVVNGVPEGFSCSSDSADKLVSDILYILSEDAGGLPDIMEQRLAGKIAALEAAGAAPLSSSAEAGRIIDTLFACENPELTPRGHRILSIISLGDIDKLF